MCLSHEQHNLGDCPSILGTSFGQTLAAHIEDRDCRSNAPHSLIIPKNKSEPFDQSQVVDGCVACELGPRGFVAGWQ